MPAELRVGCDAGSQGGGRASRQGFTWQGSEDGARRSFSNLVVALIGAIRRDKAQRGRCGPCLNQWYSMVLMGISVNRRTWIRDQVRGGSYRC